MILIADDDGYAVAGEAGQCDEGAYMGTASAPV